MKPLWRIGKYVVFSGLVFGVFAGTHDQTATAQPAPKGAQERPAVKGERLDPAMMKQTEQEQKEWETVAACITGKLKEAKELEAKDIASARVKEGKELEARETASSRRHHGRKLTRDS